MECMYVSATQSIEAFQDTSGVNLDKLCRMVCGRRVRVEHALTTGSKKQYNSKDWSHYERRYKSAVPVFFLFDCTPV